MKGCAKSRETNSGILCKSLSTQGVSAPAFALGSAAVVFQITDEGEDEDEYEPPDVPFIPK
jgi:hypothetical protein